MLSRRVEQEKIEDFEDDSTREAKTNVGGNQELASQMAGHFATIGGELTKLGEQLTRLLNAEGTKCRKQSQPVARGQQEKTANSFGGGFGLVSKGAVALVVAFAIYYALPTMK